MPQNDTYFPPVATVVNIPTVGVICSGPSGGSTEEIGGGNSYTDSAFK